MRGEVMLLTRNIEIKASEDDEDYLLDEVWGCRVLVSEFFEKDLKYRQGSLSMDSVSLHQCSQKNTYKAALKFESKINA